MTIYKREALRVMAAELDVDAREFRRAVGKLRRAVDSASPGVRSLDFTLADVMAFCAKQYDR